MRLQETSSDGRGNTVFLSYLLITNQATVNTPATQVPLITQLHTNKAVT